MVMCVRRGDSARLSFLRRASLAALFALGSIGAHSQHATAQLSDTLTRFADSTVGLSSRKWAGPRVPFPPPRARPTSTARLDSARWPVSVHAAQGVSPARVAQVLEAAETTLDLLYAAGFLTSFGDAGQAGTAGHDVYVLDGDVSNLPVLGGTPLATSLTAGQAQPLGSEAAPSARAYLDASGNFSALDGARAFAVLDARLPATKVLACTAQALIEAQLFELDPAESRGVREASAAYFATLLSGEPACDEAAPDLAAYPFRAGATTDGADWLARLSTREDRSRGTFLFDTWQLARQQTWEGHALRASPDLLEAIAKALELERTPFDLVAGELAEARALALPAAIREVRWDALPAFTPKSDPALAPLGSKHLRVQLGQPRPGLRLRAWARGEAGGRYTLSATRLDASGHALSRLELAPRQDPNGQLSIELDAATHAVLVSVTRVADVGLPDPDAVAADDLRRVSITVDRPQ
jgi:hypothetical protein